MNLLAVTTLLQVIPGLVPGRSPLILMVLVLTVLAVLAVVLMARRSGRGRLATAVVATCAICAASWFLLLPSRHHGPWWGDRSTVSVIQNGRTMVIEAPPRLPGRDLVEQFVGNPTPDHVEATVLLDEDRGVLAARHVVRGSEQGAAPAVPSPPPEQPSRKALVEQPKPESDQDRLPLPWTIVSGIALAAMIYLAYLFLDAGTRGQFTWPLRVFSVVAFVGICVLLVLYGRGS